MVETPLAFRWSSVHAHLGGLDPLITEHPAFLAVGETRQARSAWHAAWLQEAIDDEEVASIRRYINQERALGNPRFQAMVEKALGRHAAVRANGRPPKFHTGEVPNRDGGS
jgi:putative transposase